MPVYRAVENNMQAKGSKAKKSTINMLNEIQTCQIMIELIKDSPIELRHETGSLTITTQKGVAKSIVQCQSTAIQGISIDP